VQTTTHGKKVRAYGDRPARVQKERTHRLEVSRREEEIEAAKREMGWRGYATKQLLMRLAAGGWGVCRGKPPGGKRFRAEGTAAGADADVLAVREPHPWPGAVAERGVAAADGGGMAGEEEAAREQGDAEGVVSRPAWPTGQAPKCGIAVASVQGNQLGDRRGGRATACPRRCLDSAATEAVGSLGVAAGPV